MEPRTTAIAANRIFFTLLALLAFVYSTPVWAKVKIIGTYSSLTYNEEAGDLVGYEVRVIPTNQGFKAVVQVADGDAGRIYIVDVVVKTHRISFDMPISADVHGKFEGAVSINGIEGNIYFPSGNIQSVSLKRGMSYWEK